MNVALIDRLAAQAGLDAPEGPVFRFAELVRAAALEEAAAACERHGVEAQALVVTSIDDNPRSVVSRECAATIRFLAEDTK